VAVLLDVFSSKILRWHSKLKKELFITLRSKNTPIKNNEIASTVDIIVLVIIYPLINRGWCVV
jgi:hypothetical protein